MVGYTETPAELQQNAEEFGIGEVIKMAKKGLQEKEFSKMFCALLKHHGACSTKIESPTTGSGTPDAWIVSPNDIRWVEFKVKNQTFFEYRNNKQERNERKTITIPWRAEQRSFHNLTWMYSNHKEIVTTICQFEDCIVLFAPNCTLTGNTFKLADMPHLVYNTATDLAKAWSILRVTIPEVDKEATEMACEVCGIINYKGEKLKNRMLSAYGKVYAEKHEEEEEAAKVLEAIQNYKGGLDNAD